MSLALLLECGAAAAATRPVSIQSDAIHFDIPPTYPVRVSGATDTYSIPRIRDRQILVADLDGVDGPDLVVTSFDSVFTMFNKGDGTFGPPIPTPLGFRLINALLCDVDGDGDADLIAVCYDGFVYSLQVRSNTGGHFGPAAQQPLPGQPARLVAADFDHDAAPDLAMISFFADSLWLLRNDNGKFRLFDSVPLPSRPVNLLADDLNGDGNPDIVISCSEPEASNGSVCVLLNSGAMTFAVPVSHPLPDAAYGLTAIPHDPGGPLDLLLIAKTRVLLMPGAGDGSFGEPRQVLEFMRLGQNGYLSGFATHAITAADLDGDGTLDLVYHGPQPCFFEEREFACVARGLGSGHFSDPLRYAIPAGPHDIVATDVDRDGWPDLLALTQGPEIDFLGDLEPPGVTVLRNRADGTLRAMLETQIIPNDLDQLGFVPSLHAAHVRTGPARDLMVTFGDTTYTMPNLGHDVFGRSSAVCTGFLRAMRDLNGDGLEDAIVTRGESTFVWRSAGSGTFDEAGSYEAGSWVGLGDLEGDGRIDLVLRATEDKLVELRGDLNGAFEAPETLAAAVPTDPFAWSVADMNGDGLADLLCAFHGDNDSLAIITQTVDRTWTESAVIALIYPDFFNYYRPFAIVPTDIDADGRMDAVVLSGCCGGSDGGGVFNIIHARGSTFETAGPFYAGNSASDIRVADLDLDGYPEVITVYSNGFSQFHFMYFENDGTGEVLPGVHHRVQDLVSGLDVADMNGDLLPDVITYSPRWASIRITRNASIPPVATAATMSLVSSHADPGAVRLEWFAAQQENSALVIERRAANADAWSTIARVTLDAAGFVRYIDRTVAPGARYAYRLRGAAANATVLTAEAWIDVPAAAGLELRGVFPNPTSQQAIVSFVTPTPGPSTLEVIDIAGRRVDTTHWDRLEAGEHAARLGRQGVTLRPGVYWVRLAMATEVKSARFVVTP